jgi:hypothetical protein
MTIKEARKLVTMDVLWDYFDLLGEPMPSMCSPLRQDSRPSFSIYERDGVEYFKDFGTDEGGDTYELFKTLSGITDDQEAYRAFIRLAHGIIEGIPKKPRQRNRPKSRTLWLAYCSPLHNPTEDQLALIHESRGHEVTIDGLKYAVSKGHLKVGNILGQDNFVYTDNTFRNGDRRPLATKYFPDGSKSKALPGIPRNWPVGTKEMVDGDYPFVMLVEGSGDALAALSAIHGAGREDVAVVAMLGATTKIPTCCLEYFQGRHVCIYPDNDKAGLAAFRRWSSQLSLVTENITVFDLRCFQRPDGQPVKDLGELFALMNSGDVGQATSLLPQ